MSHPQRVRVLHIYAGNLYGGIEKLLLTLAVERHRCPEMEPEFAICFEGRLADELRAAGVQVHMLGAVRLSRPWTTWLARNRLKHVLRRGSFHVAITHGCWLHAAFAPAVRNAGTRLWFWAHDAYLQLGKIDRAAARTKPDHVIANSHFTLGTVPALFPGVTGEVIYCPIAPPPSIDRAIVRQAVRAELGCSIDKTVIFMGARLEPWKGHKLLLEALACLNQQTDSQPAWEAWIAGGPQRPHEVTLYAQLQEMANELGLGQRVRWLGQRKDMPRLLAAADIHCQPNTGPEPFGIVFIEAMYAGLPVITTRIGAAPEIVDDTCGVLVEPDNKQALAKALACAIASDGREYQIAGPARANAMCNAETQLKLLSAAIEESMKSR